MTTYGYTTVAGANEAKAVGVGMPVSYKQSYEVTKFIRGKPVQLAKKMLEDVIAMKRPVPMTRFHGDTGHKHGMAAGRFPVSTCEYILRLLKSAESNAQFKGLSTANLIIKRMAAQKGPTSWRYGRHKRRQAKCAHVEIVLAEVKDLNVKKERKVKTAAERKAAPAKAAAAPVQTPAKTQVQKQPVKKEGVNK